MSIFIFVDRVQPIYKKAYKKHRDKLFPLYEVKRIEVGSETYTLVGQQRMKGFPLFSDFDVFDKDGSSVDESVAKEIYEYVSRISVAEKVLNRLWGPLTNQLQQSTLPTDYKALLKVEDEEFSILSRTLEKSHKALADLLELVHSLLKKEQWNEKDIAILEEKWTAFLNEYETRAKLLLKIKERMKKLDYEDKLIDNLWEEIEGVFEVYASLTPLGAKVGSFSLNELIAYHYRFGKRNQEDAPLKKDNKGSRGLYAFVLYLFRFSVWFFIPFIIYALWLDNELTFASVMPILAFGVMAFYAKNLNRSHVMGKVYTIVSERRAILEQHAVDVQNTSREQTENPTTAGLDSDVIPKTLYETKVFVYQVMYIILVFLAVFVMVPIIAFFTGDSIDVAWVIYPLLISVIAASITIYPYQIFSWKRFAVTETSMNVGARKVGVAEIRGVRTLAEKSLVFLYVTYADDPFKLRIHHADYDELLVIIKKFCGRYNIPFEEN